MTAAGRAEVERLGTAFEPTVGCVPKSMPGIMNQPYPLEFVRQADAVVLKIEEYDVVRTIHFGPSTNADAARAPSLLGHSVGRWDGPVLTVTTTDVAVRPFSGPLGRVPLSAQAVFVERFTPSEDGASLDYRMVVTDPVYLTGPVTVEKRWINVPGTQVLPYDCKL